MCFKSLLQIIIILMMHFFTVFVTKTFFTSSLRWSLVDHLVASETLSTTSLFRYIIPIHICFCLESIHLRLSAWLFAPASIPPGQSWGQGNCRALWCRPVFLAEKCIFWSAPILPLPFSVSGPYSYLVKPTNSHHSPLTNQQWVSCTLPLA